jgi:hypothetical protein
MWFITSWDVTGVRPKGHTGGRSELGKRLTTWHGPDGAKDRKRTVVYVEEALQAEIVVEEWKKAMEAAGIASDGVTLWTDGSRTEDGACGYAVVWRKKGEVWKGHQVHLGYNQKVYDAECAAIVRALQVGRDSRNQLQMTKITIFTDAQAAM